MSCLLDSDWLVDHLKGLPDAAAVGDLAPDGLAISVITYGAAYAGIHYEGDPDRYRRAFRRVYGALRCSR